MYAIVLITGSAVNYYATRFAEPNLVAFYKYMCVLIILFLILCVLAPWLAFALVAGYVLFWIVLLAIGFIYNANQ
jgi:hypothetical protein